MKAIPYHRFYTISVHSVVVDQVAEPALQAFGIFFF